ncbi:hypothetical protein H0H81_000782 [Sphagnurus paluster]|uniref:Uncharacterized protein n=1 Tax=Sphagnurus paluster TaxID=117069 RepID=A0A9P7GTZ2_9AGAR|nr:hypothetical protein H0H81_000782 [Sphagnurus paluster]
MEIIGDVQRLGLNIYDTIDTSKEVALSGHKLSQDLSSFFRYLRDKKTSTEELHEHVGSMLRLSEKSRKNAHKVCETFSNTRKGIYAVTNRVPAEVCDLADEQDRNVKKLAAGEKEIQTLKVAKSCTMAGAAVVAAVSMVAFPPALLFLPVALPLLTLVIEARELHATKKNEKREKKIYECKDAISQLEQIAEGLQKLVELNDAFASYWSRIETTLQVVDGRIEELRRAKFLGLRLSTIEKSCDEIGNAQLDYHQKVSVT